jgi:large subunit ribosomal protein L18
MQKITRKIRTAALRKHRVRTIVQGTTERPRLSVNISNQHVTAQIIDDSKHVTIAYATTVGSKVTGTMTEKAAAVGADIAKKAKAAKVSTVAFDRGSRLYHGRVKALADAARNAGLEF